MTGMVWKIKKTKKNILLELLPSK